MKRIQKILTLLLTAAVMMSSTGAAWAEEVPVLPESSSAVQTEGADSESTAPEGSDPEGTVPEGTDPEGTAPEGTDPEGSVPDGSDPEGTVPGDTDPEGTVPEETDPEGTVPEGSDPEGTVPGGTDPEGDPVPGDNTSVPGTDAVPLQPAVSTLADGTISSVDELKAAFASGGEFTLTASVKCPVMLTLDEGKTLDLDLGGNTLTFTYRDFVEDAGSGKTYLAAINNKGTLTIDNGTVSMTASNTGLVNFGTLNLGSDAVLSTMGPSLNNLGGEVTTAADISSAGTVSGDGKVTIYSDCIISYGGTVEITGGVLDSTAASGTALTLFNREYKNDTEGAEATISGGTFNSYYFAATTNNLYSNNCSLTITGGELNSVYSAIYWPSAGALTIGNDDGTGPVITATEGSAVEICCGTLEILGGTLNGNAGIFTPTDNYLVEGYRQHDGGASTGDAVTVISRRAGNAGSGYVSAPLSVVIRDGIFNSTQNYGLRYLDCNTAPGAEQLDQEVTFRINGGTFNGKAASLESQYIADGEKQYIYGGRFAMGGVDSVIESYLADNYVLAAETGYWVVSETDADGSLTAQPSAPTSSVSEVETPAVPEGVTPPTAEETQAAADAAVADVTGNEAVNRYVPAGMAEAAEGVVVPEAGENIRLRLSITLEDITLAAVVSEDKEVALVPASLSFDVTPQKLEDSTWSEIPSLNGKPVTFRLPIPDSVAERYARVAHAGDADRYLEILTDPGTGAKYIELSSSRFSPFIVTFVNSLPSTPSGDSSGSSFTERQTEFWEEVKETLKKAEPGDTVKVNARSYDQMPYSVMKLLGELDNVTLHISWNGGEDILIPSAFAVNEAQRVYYPLSYLEGMDFGTAQGTGTPDKVNPETGGILWVEAPVSDDLGDVPVTDAKLGLAADPDKTEAAIEAPAVEYEAEPAEKAESTGNAAVLGIAGVALLAAGAGYWYWKRRELR